MGTLAALGIVPASSCAEAELLGMEAERCLGRQVGVRAAATRALNITPRKRAVGNPAAVSELSSRSDALERSASPPRAAAASYPVALVTPPPAAVGTAPLAYVPPEVAGAPHDGIVVPLGSHEAQDRSGLLKDAAPNARKRGRPVP